MKQSPRDKPALCWKLKKVNEGISAWIPGEILDGIMNRIQERICGRISAGILLSGGIGEEILEDIPAWVFNGSL